MKRFAVHLALFAMLANSAFGGVLVSTNNLGLSSNGFDVWEVHIAGYTGVDDVANNTISGIEGLFASVAGTMSWNGTTQGTRNSNGSNVLMGGGSGSGEKDGTGSWVNFDSYAVGLTRTGAATAATGASATWFTTDALMRLRPVDADAGTVDDDFIDQTLLAQVFVSPGGAVSFNGKINTSAAVGAPFSFTIGGAVVNPDPIAVTVNPASGTVRNPGQSVSVENAAAGPNGRDSATIAGLTVTSVAGTFGQVGLSNGVVAPGGNQVGTVTFDGTGLLNGYTANGNLSFSVAPGPNGAGTGGGPYTYPLQALVSGNVGDGIAPTGPGGSYAGLSGTSGLTSAGGSVHLPSTFSILAGSNANGGGTVVSGVWTLRALNEQRPGFTNPPLPDFASALTSDKVNLTGMDGDVFVLQMSYAESELEGNEADDAAKGHLYLATLNGNGEWVNAIALNHGANVGATNVQGAWSGQLALGTWGVDTAANTVWAVLDHNSVFASVPEPSTILLGLMGLVGLVGLARRRRS